MPEMYVHLYLALEPGRGARPERSAAGERALVLRLDVEQLMRDVIDLILTWSQVVQHAAGLSDRNRRRSRPARPAPTVAAELAVLACDVPTREVVTVDQLLERLPVRTRQAPADSTAGAALTSSCRTLAAHLPVLIAQPRTATGRTVSDSHLEHLDDFEVTRWMEGGALIVEHLTGVQAALRILALHKRAEKALTVTRGKDRLAGMRCPDCESAALARWHGSDQVECEACGERWPAQEWSRLMRALAAVVGDAPRPARARPVPVRPGDHAAGGGVAPRAVAHLPDFEADPATDIRLRDITRPGEGSPA